MAPFMQAIRTTKLYENSQEHAAIYTGLVDPEWTYEGFPHGGFVLALMVNAALQFQSNFSRKDILHLSAHFISAVQIGPCQIRFIPIRTGQSFHNVRADLFQKDKLKLTTIMLFGSFGSNQRKATTQNQSLTLAFPSPLARTIPIYIHPSCAKPAKKIPQARFKTRMEWSFNPGPFQRNRLAYLSPPDWSHRAEAKGSRQAGGGGMEWSAWWDWVDDDVVLNAATLTFFSDVFQRLPDLLAWAQDSGDSIAWSYTTLVLNIEFKAPFPDEPHFSRRSVGLYSQGSFMRDGLHDGRVEIWTAPSGAGIGKGVEVGEWRQNQICLAVASQMTLAFPLGGKEKAKL